MSISTAEGGEFWELGYCIPNADVDEAELVGLDALFETLGDGPGCRLSPADPRVAPLATSGMILEIAAALLDEEPVPLRAILFMKSANQNWLIPWHQDVTLAAPRRVERLGYRAWTQKDGLWHVRPPVEVLQRMVAIRVHLDACGVEDGPLRVIPRTHERKLSRDEVAHLSSTADEVTLAVGRGQVILMHPLTLHASSKSTGSSRRRVLHIEYCARSAYPF